MTTAWNPESYWDEHPQYTVELWRYEVANDDTRSSYHDWVNRELEIDAEDAAEVSP